MGIKLFSEIKRVVDQFFETEYFYRWRKITYYDWFEGKLIKSYGRALDHLNNTWDGDTSLLNILNDKIFHMYVNLRKYGITSDRYVNRLRILEDGNEKDKYLLFLKGLDDEIDSEVSSGKNTSIVERELYIGGLDSKDAEGVQTDYTFCKFTITNKKTKEVSHKYGIKTITIRKTGETRNVSVLKSVDDDLKVVNEKEPVKKQTTKSILYIEKPKSLDEIKNILKKVSGKTVTDDDLFLCIHAVSLDLSDYIALSDKLKKRVIGKLPALHSLWQFRRMINKLYDMDELEEPYLSKHEKALKGVEDDKKVTEIGLRLHEEFIADKKKYARKVADFYVDHCGSWWD